VPLPGRVPDYGDLVSISIQSVHDKITHSKLLFTDIWRQMANIGFTSRLSIWRREEDGFTFRVGHVK
jgi:hypothetical protein